MMTLKDLHGICSLVNHHRKPALLPRGECANGAGLTTFRHLLHCGFPSSFWPGDLAGVGFAVLKLMQWHIFIYFSCFHSLDLVPAADGQKVGGEAAGPSPVLCWLAVHGSGAFRGQQAGVAFLLLQGTGWWGCRAALQLQQAGAWGSESAPPSQLGNGSLGGQPASSLGCRHLHAGSLPSFTAFQVLVLSPAFPVPSLVSPVSGCTQLHLF